MTVSSTSSRVVYSGNGVATSFPFPFKVSAAADLVVVLTDALGNDTVLSASQYGATGFGQDEGGTVTYPLAGSPLGAGTRLTVLRAVAVTQPTQISNQGAMWPAVIEAALDRLTYIAQHIADQVSRALRVAPTDSALLAELPNPVQRANTLLGFDAQGQPYAARITAGLVSASSWVVNNLLPAGSAAAARAALGALAAGDNIAFTGSNTHAGSETFAGTVTLSGKALNEAQGANIASASSIALGAAAGNYVRVTGTTTITALGAAQAGTRRIVEFAGTLTLTHNGTSLMLPSGASITTAAGDVAVFVSRGAGNWKCTGYQRADGRALATSYVPPQRAYARATVAGGEATVQKQAGVASVVRTGAGLFTVTLSAAMPDAHYRVLATATFDSGDSHNGALVALDSAVSRTTTAFGLIVGRDGAGQQDPEALDIEVLA